MVLAYMARNIGVNFDLVERSILGNMNRKKQMADRILNMVKDIENPKMGVYGLAFKNGTDYCRESPVVDIVNNLLKNSVDISAYDPKAMDTARSFIGDKIRYAENMHDTVRDTDVLAVLTE